MNRPIEIHHVKLSPEEQIGSHRHSSWELSYVIKGNGKRTTGDCCDVFEAGDLVLVPPDMPHCWTFDRDE